jgi:choline dehydrogenase-like flavoprotein
MLTTRGVHPYRVHTAAEQVPGCLTCSGYLCPSGCKNDALRICLTPALEKHGAHLLAECAATFLDADRTHVRRVVCSWRGRRIELRAKTVILAAGGFFTPALLLNSRSDFWPNGVANDSGLVGRNLMLHATDLYVLTKAPKASVNAWNKEIAFNDYYAAGSEKLGTVQSGGRPPPLAYHRNQPNLNLWRLLGPLAPLVWNPLSQQPFLAAILEDLPYPENRVWSQRAVGPQGNDRLCFRYRLGASDLRRRRVFRKALTSLLQPFRPIRVFRIGDSSPDLTHVCGTCRFGTDRRSSVLDPWNRAHGLDNLYVVDASFFPSSGGTNPSLTIAANALRVGHYLKTTT